MKTGTIERVESRAVHVPDPRYDPRGPAPVPRKLVSLVHTAVVHTDDGSVAIVNLGSDEECLRMANDAMLDRAKVEVRTDDGRPRLVIRRVVVTKAYPKEIDIEIGFVESMEPKS